MGTLFFCIPYPIKKPFIASDERLFNIGKFNLFYSAFALKIKSTTSAFEVNDFTNC